MKPLSSAFALARSGTTAQEILPTGEAKNRPPGEHRPALAQSAAVFLRWALLIRSGTDAHMCPRSLNCREQVRPSQTQRPVVFPQQKQLWVINTQTRIDGHKHTYVDVHGRGATLQLLPARGTEYPDSCEFLWRKDGGMAAGLGRRRRGPSGSRMRRNQPLGRRKSNEFLREEVI